MAIFDYLFMKKDILPNERLTVMKFYTNIASRWLLLIQRKKCKSLVKVSSQEVISTCLQVSMFLGYHIYDQIQQLIINHQTQRTAR